MNNDAIPHNAKSKSFEVGNNATLLQIVGHHPTARARKEKYNSFAYLQDLPYLRLVLM